MLAELLKALDDQEKLLNIPVEVIVTDNAPERSAEAIASQSPGVRYVHEEKLGVAHNRNRGIQAARGRYIVFIDDDELPEPGWLRAVSQAADQKHALCFGKIEAHFDSPPQAHLKSILQKAFGRDFDLPDYADITAYRAYLGTGNSMFDRTHCFDDDEPFDPRFNRGGEDVWLIRHLVEAKGLRISWLPQAKVKEIVPADRMTTRYLKDRKYVDGVLRCIVDWGNGDLRSAAKVGFWMAAGAIQATVFSLMGRFLKLLGRREAEKYLIRSRGGLGKLLWMVDPRAKGR